MAEVQRTTESGETTQLFVQFVMMQSHQTLLALGQHPNSGNTTGATRNLPLAKVFIDQLGMIETKTAGNLSAEEERILTKTMASLRDAYRRATEHDRTQAHTS